MNGKRDICIATGKEFRWKENVIEVREEPLREGGNLPFRSLAVWLDCVTYQTSSEAPFLLPVFS